MAEFDNKTCARLEVQEGLHDSTVKKTLFVKSVWEPTISSPTSFSLAISDGREAWTFEGSEAFVEERAEVWDKKVSWVMEKLKFYLTVGQSGVAYHFIKIRDNRRKLLLIEEKLSFEIQDRDTNLSLTANFSLLNASSETVTSDLLGFLLHGNDKLTVDYSKKRRDFDGIVVKNQALVELSKQDKNEKIKFQRDVFQKFVLVLLSKKSKLRELRKQNARLTEQLRAKEDIEENYTTSSSSDDDEEESDHQQLLPEKRMERGEGSGERLVHGDAVVIADPDTTQTFVDQLEIEPPNEHPSSNAVAALVAATPYMGLQRKRRRT